MPNAEDSVNKNIIVPGRVAYIIEELNDDEAGELFKSIVHTVAIGNYCEPGDGTAKIVFMLILEELRHINHCLDE